MLPSDVRTGDQVARMRGPTIEPCDWRPCDGTISSTDTTRKAEEPGVRHGAACSTHLDRKSWHSCHFFVAHNSCTRAPAGRFPIRLHFTFLPQVRHDRACSIFPLFLRPFFCVIHKSIASGESVSKGAQKAPCSQHEHFLLSRRCSGSTGTPGNAYE